jgi:hypothetical protein
MEEYGGINLYAFVGNRPPSTIDPLGLCTRQDVDNTAIYMGLMFNQRTAKSGLETCGVICCSAKTGQVYTGKVVLAQSRNEPCKMGESKCECGDTVLAYWHTHPKGYDRMVPDDPEKFSWDRFNMYGMQPRVPWYMTNTRDETTVLDPATGEEKVIHPIKAL